jgi:MerR family copper efflux transcriptional regulator
MNSLPDKPLTIGQVARRAGVGVETVRFYERQGLLKDPPRKLSGYREYDEDVVVQLRFIRRAKQLGFTLKEIKELLSLRQDSEAPAAELKSQAEAKIADIEAKIQTLQTMKGALLTLTCACRGQGTVAECPLLHALDREDEP